MTPFLTRLPAFSGVAPGFVANCAVPKGPTYRTFLVRYERADGGGVMQPATEAQILADIEYIHVKIDGVVYLEWKPAELLMDTKFLGLPTRNGVIKLHLAWPTAREAVLEDATMWGTRDVGQITMEVKLASGIATAMRIEAAAWILPLETNLGPITKVTRIPTSSSVAGIFEISNIPPSLGDLVRIHFISPNITGLEVQIDQVRWLDVSRGELEASYEDTGKVPQSGVLTWDPCWLDRFNDRVPLEGRRDTRFKLALSAPGAIDMVMVSVVWPKGAPRPA